MKITDAEFKSSITLADAHRVMCKFIEQYNTRGECGTLDLLSAISLESWSDGSSADPAQLGDFVLVASQIVGSTPQTA